jgi:hypothetical protein
MSGAILDNGLNEVFSFKKESEYMEADLRSSITSISKNTDQKLESLQK